MWNSRFHSKPAIVFALTQANSNRIKVNVQRWHWDCPEGIHAQRQVDAKHLISLNQGKNVQCSVCIQGTAQKVWTAAW